jgi:hypothetical protein
LPLWKTLRGTYYRSIAVIATKAASWLARVSTAPFSRCIYDQPGGRQHWLKRARDREIARKYTTEDKGAKELALEFGVSQRTIQRALKKTIRSGGITSDE